MPIFVALIQNNYYSFHCFFVPIFFVSVVRRHRLDRLCASRSSASDYSGFRFPVMLSGSVTQYPLTTATTTTTTTTNTTTPTTLATTKTRADLDSMAASYESVGELKSNRTSIAETTSGAENGISGVKTGIGSPPKRGVASLEAGCDWVVSPGWKLRRRTEATVDQLPVASDRKYQLPVSSDRKSANGEDKASSGGQSESGDDLRSQSAQGKENRI